MAIDIALYVRVHVQSNDLKEVKSNTSKEPPVNHTHEKISGKLTKLSLFRLWACILDDP